jgi:hypothetical protein
MGPHEEKGTTAEVDHTLDDLRRQLVRSQDEVASLRRLLHRLVIGAASCLESEASPELLAEVEAAVGAPWPAPTELILAGLRLDRCSVAVGAALPVSSDIRRGLET